MDKENYKYSEGDKIKVVDKDDPLYCVMTTIDHLIPPLDEVPLEDGGHYKDYGLSNGLGTVFESQIELVEDD